MSIYPAPEEFDPRLLKTLASHGWVGVDLDGTLAHYTGWKGPDHIGAPIPRTVELIRKLLEAGIQVKILTARCGPQTGGGQSAAHAIFAIRAWCMKHLGRELSVTNEKDYHLMWLFDDRCSQVVQNSGLILAPDHLHPKLATALASPSPQAPPQNQTPKPQP